MKRLVYRLAVTLAAFTFTFVLIQGGRIYVAGFRAIVVFLGVLLVFILGGFFLRLGLVLMTPQNVPEDQTEAR